MAITFPSDTKTIIDQIRTAIGRLIYINLTTSTAGCLSCTLDPINNSSVDATCSGCGGNYWIVTAEDVSISGHVRWSPFDEQNFQTGGIVWEGDCIVTIEYTGDNLSNVRNANYFTVDDKTLVLDKYVLRGKPSVNRIRLLLKERE